MTEDMLMLRGLVGMTLAVLVLLVAGCGADTNFNQLWADDEARDSRYAKARVLYDQGEHEEAEKILDKILAVNGQDAEAAILAGYNYLSLGKIDTFNLARALIELGDDDSGTTTGDGAGLTQDSEANDASETLKSLGSLINLSEADFNNLGTQYQGTTSLFQENVVYQPNTVTDELRANVEVLNYMNKAVRAVCRFVDTEAKVVGEPRHDGESCATSTVTGPATAKAHFLWAFSHLTEALVYQSVLLYSGTQNAEASSNFQNAANDLDNFTGDFTGFVDAITDMKTAIDAVFDTDDPNSMISSTLFNLEAVNNAFAALPGLPEDLTSRVTDALEEIKRVGDSVGGDTGDVSALKGQMTEKFADIVSEKIDTAINEELTGTYNLPADTSLSDIQASDQLTDEQKAAITETVSPVCDSFYKQEDDGTESGLAAGIPAEDLELPTTCQ